MFCCCSIDNDVLSDGALMKELPFVCPEVMPTEEDSAVLARVIREVSPLKNYSNLLNFYLSIIISGLPPTEHSRFLIHAARGPPSCCWARNERCGMENF